MQSSALRIAVTGAAGFIGQAVIERIERELSGANLELRLNDIAPLSHPTAAIFQGTYCDRSIRDALIGDGIDILFHLASLPGGASERDSALGKSVNLDGSIALIDAVARPNGPIVVYTSTIAALGRSEGPVNDATALRPAGSYGTHKAMVEYYLADLTRQGLIDARSVRPAGIVARPQHTYAGFATAWMSDLFHAAAEHRVIAIPSRADAHIWLQSIDVVGDNIVHAALIPPQNLPQHRSWTLPATVVRVDALVSALGRRTGHVMQVEYGDGPTDQPPLDASKTLALGFTSDGDVDALVDAVLSRLAS